MIFDVVLSSFLKAFFGEPLGDLAPLVWIVEENFQHLGLFFICPGQAIVDGRAEVVEPSTLSTALPLPALFIGPGSGVFAAH